MESQKIKEPFLSVFTIFKRNSTNSKCHYFLLKLILCYETRHKNFVGSMTNLFGAVMGPKYDGKYLRSLTDGLLGNLTLKQTLTDVIIPTFDIKLLQPVIFSTYDV